MMAGTLTTEHTVPTGLNRVHPFERAGLGVAPFRCIGGFRAVFKAAPDAPAQPGASCNYCGMGIMDVYRVRGADGREFNVGCDCVMKVWREFDATIPPDFRQAVAQVEREKRDARREVKWQRLKARIARANALLDASPDLFTDQPHPYDYHAGKGLTLRDYLAWMLAHAGDAGRTAACREIEKAAANDASLSTATTQEGR